MSPLDRDILRYLSGISATATNEEVHRQVSNGGRGRLPAMVKIALARLVQDGLVDKVNGEYRLATGARQ